MTEPRIHPSTLPRQPRTWAMPAEPPADVTLGDRDGKTWSAVPRAGGSPSLWQHIDPDVGSHSLITFVELLTWRGPLTEVVDET